MLIIILLAVTLAWTEEINEQDEVPKVGRLSSERPC